MKKTLLILLLGITTTINSQNWNTIGDNTTTGKVFANNLLINRGLISSDEVDSQKTLGMYRVGYSGHSRALLDVSGFGGSTPRFQLMAHYADRLFFRAARDGETNWDNKGFREIVTTDENGKIDLPNTNIISKSISANNLLINRGLISSDEVDSQKTLGMYRVGYSGHSRALLDVSGFGGSTPRFQLMAHYADRLFFRAARDGETNWDNKGFREIVTTDESGKVGIGTLKPDSMLTVAGKIHSQEVLVTINAGADFVFENDYNLPSLKNVEKYIKENKHLPEIDSAKEMKLNGLKLAEMNIKLLQKIEELTLYTINQEKEIQKLKEQNKIVFDLQKRLEKIESKN